MVMSKNVSNSINKGLPTDVEVTLKYMDLEYLFSNKRRINRIINTAMDKVINYMASKGCYSPNFSFCNDLVIKLDKNDLNRYLVFDYYSLVLSLLIDLNMSCHFSDYGSLGKFNECFNKRLDILESINDDNVLKKEFPLLYKSYFNELEQFSANASIVSDLSKLSFDDRVKYIDFLCKKYNMSKKDFVSIINNYDKFSLDSFIKDYVMFFKNLVNNIEDISNFVDNNRIDMDAMGDHDIDKFELYVAYRYFKSMDYFTDISDKQKFLYYVSSYFKEHNNMDDDKLKVGIDVSKNDDMYLVSKTITPKGLYDMYVKFLIENPRAIIVDFDRGSFQGMNFDEVVKFMDEYYKDISVNWDFLMPGDNSFCNSAINNNDNFSNEDYLDKDVRKRELFMAKKTFYDSTYPSYRIKGKGAFSGYIGFIYSNGIVVMDKFYNNDKTGSLSYGDAIYVMDIKNFYTLSILSKSDLMRNEFCRRYIHSGNWQERVKREINFISDTSSEDIISVVDNNIKRRVRSKND